ncbi:BT_3928 family protein [Flavobacterium caeni]|uniref:DoxX protein n=1 Tax=Flavobacterium caeni TaxID=490189 RepID=A0A1G5BBW9_9FLAO|nr:BT_3928 family protein [Flavobacterium caeni]SCX87596.1 DoxX protein [Flavobacterium caeni]
MRNILTQFSRVFVGVLFIISGLIKLNDPVGFSYKLAEYFGETVLNLPFLIPYALGLAIFIVIFETVLGVMLLLGYQPKFTVGSLLLMIVFFTFLTFYSAYFNKVTDCGCFGDALKLTPWESFTKDVVLLFFILILAANLKLIKPILGKKFTNGLVVASVVACCFMGYWVLNHLPLKDFRAYKAGTNIPEGMAYPAHIKPKDPIITFIYKVNGVDTKFSYQDVMDGKIPADAVYVDRIDEIDKTGYVPPIHDFTMEKDGSDHKDEFLAEPKLMVFVAYDLTKSSAEGMQKLEALHQLAKGKGYKVIAMTASGETEIAGAKKQFGQTFDYYFCDGTTLKTIERANPSIVLIEKGTIKQKVHYNDIDQLTL